MSSCGFQAMEISAFLWVSDGGDQCGFLGFYIGKLLCGFLGWWLCVWVLVVGMDYCGCGGG